MHPLSWGRAWVYIKHVILPQSYTHPSKPLPDHRCGVRLIWTFWPARITETCNGFCRGMSNYSLQTQITTREMLLRNKNKKIKTLHSLIMTKLNTNEIICKVWLLMHHKLHASTKINCNGILRNEVWLIAHWVFCGSYPFTVLHHRSNILEVLKVPWVHRTKLDQLITDSEPLLKETITKIIGEPPQQCFAVQTENSC